MKGEFNRQAFMKRFEERARRYVSVQCEQRKEERQREEKRASAVWWDDLWWQLAGAGACTVFMTDIVIGYVRWLA